MRLLSFVVLVAWTSASLSPTLSPTSSPTLTPRYKFGQSVPLTGSLYSRMGISLQAGIKAAFRMKNDAGGVHGHMLDLITYDDGGVTAAALNNTQQLIQDKVLGLMTYIKGTTSTQALLAPNSLPMIAPYAGWRSLRMPVNRYIFHTRASMDEETHAWVSYCIARGITLFSVYYQDDSYGRNGLESIKFTLANRGLALLSAASFPADSTNVSIAGIKSVGIDPQTVVVIGGTPEPLGQFIALAKKQWPACLFYATSFGPDYLMNSLVDNNVSAAQAKDIFVTQVFPIPQPLNTLLANPPGQGQGHSSLLLDFALAMNATCSTCNLTPEALEGFVAGSLVAEVVDRMGEFAFTNPQFRPYLNQMGVNASDVSLDHEPSVKAWREYLIDTLYGDSTFIVSGLRLGPYVPNITCPANSVDCVQPTSNPCSQGMQNVFLTQPDIVNRRYLELPQWRVASPSCNFFSQPVPQDELPLVFGQSAVFSGNAPDLGTDMRNGILAAFAEANMSPAKGVRGRELLLLSMDDYYLPTQAAVNAKALINQSLLAVIGSVGTPPTEAVIPVYTAAGVPLIGPQSGARSMRNPWVINLRALYDDEVAGMVAFAIGRGLKKVSILAQNDSFGESGIAALTLSLAFHKLQLHSVQKYNRLDTNFTPPYVALTKAGPPEVLVLFGTGKPCAAFIEATLNNSAWSNTLFISASPSDPDRYQKQLSQAALRTERVFATTVMPPVSNDTLSVQYLAALRLLDSRLFRGQPYIPTLLSFEGYLLGRFVVAALARVTEFTGKAMLDEIHATYGIKIGNYSFGPYTSQCNMGLRDTYLVRIENSNTSAFSLMELFRAQAHNSFIDNCGALTLYDTSFSCPEGYTKEYVDEVSLASTCKLCLSPYGCQLPERVADMTLRSAMLGLNIVGFLVALVFLGIVWRYRYTVTIKAVSPPFCVLILLGAIMGYVFVFIQYDPMPTDDMCMAQVYILNTASCLIFASLFAKVFRVTQIFKPRSTEAFRVLKIRDGPLFIGVGGMWCLFMIYTAIWHATSPLVVVHNQNPEEQYYFCESEDSLWGIVDILANGIFLLYGVMLSIQSRKIPTVFNEAKFVAATMYNTLIIGTIAILAGYGLAKNNDQLFMYKALGSFIVFTVDMGLLIGSKLPSLYAELFRGKIPQFKNDSSSDANSGTNDTSKTRESSTTTRAGRVEMEKRSPTLSGISADRTPATSPRSNTISSSEPPAAGAAVSIPVD